MTGKKLDISLLDKWRAANRAMLDPRLNPTDACVFSRLLYHHNSKSDRCFPSQDTLAAALGVTTRTIRTSLTKLEKSGFIRKLGQRRGGGSINYRLNILGEEEFFRTGGKKLPKGWKQTSDDTWKEKEKEKSEFASEREEVPVIHGSSYRETVRAERSPEKFQGALVGMLGGGERGWKVLVEAPESLMGRLENSYLREEINLSEAKKQLLDHLAASVGEFGP
ncbi:helix-turn-helix domain-containing protein [Maritimibacter sp. 55A14]|uniref:helix-turn-helix domain-containing protein n=1 Tax=Maritimibacter sp. 55A14 TaxID=2174844 RepID=UPI001304FA06|nr:helix-turn-helix domain-containing protein [Maritimibacter sp. 55A14]